MFSSCPGSCLQERAGEGGCIGEADVLNPVILPGRRLSRKNFVSHPPENALHFILALHFDLCHSIIKMTDTMNTAYVTSKGQLVVP
ncbi:MAG: hypothetical protein ABSG04_06435, partial [Verrucomicrobiota bacterium]